MTSWKDKLTKISEGYYILPKEGTMRVDARIFMTEKLLRGPDGTAGLEEATFDQIVNATSFPGVTRVVITPDAHHGFGVPIGTVIESDGTLLPTAAGYDIGCGMIQLKTTLNKDDVANPIKRKKWIAEVIRKIAVGTGASQVQSQRQISNKLFDDIIRFGAKALGRTSKVTERDFIPVDDIGIDIPERSIQKANQLGSLGGGNHFTEMQVDTDGNVWVMIHTGSRGFGWNIAKKFFTEGGELLGLKPGKDSEDHVWLDFEKPLGKAYWNLHNMAANFATANRLIIGEAVCAAVEDVFGGSADIYYEISHNLIQKENGKFVARKGATRAFPAGHSALEGTKWETTGHPILIPGSMETGSAILFASSGAAESIYSINHGAGRLMSRNRATRELDQNEANVRMNNADIVINTANVPIDESGPCYKNLDDVLHAVEVAGLATVAYRMKPVACIKGAD